MEDLSDSIICHYLATSRRNTEGHHVFFGQSYYEALGLAFQKLHQVVSTSCVSALQLLEVEGVGAIHSLTLRDTRNGGGVLLELMVFFLQMFQLLLLFSGFASPVVYFSLSCFCLFLVLNALVQITLNLALFVQGKGKSKKD